MAKQQTMMHSMQINPFSQGIFYSQNSNSGYNVAEQNAQNYPEEMKKCF